jgi:hypothetical protein
MCIGVFEIGVIAIVATCVGIVVGAIVVWMIVDKCLW